MRNFIAFVATVLMTTTLAVSAGQFAPPSYLHSYELYSWPDSSGEWRFRLLPGPSGVNLRADQVLDRKFTLGGVKDLERKIAELPKGSVISWVEQPSISGSPHIKRSESFAYPPRKTIQEIREYAERHKVGIDIPEGRKMYEAPGSDDKP